MKSVSIFILLILVNIVILNNVFINCAEATSLRENFNKSLQTTGDKTGYVGTGLDKKNPADVVGFIIKAFLGLVGVFFLLLMIYGGYTWMLARGNETEVQKAQSIIQNAIIGLVIVFCAYGITMFFSRIIKPT